MYEKSAICDLKFN